MPFSAALSRALIAAVTASRAVAVGSTEGDLGSLLDERLRLAPGAAVHGAAAERLAHALECGGRARALPGSGRSCHVGSSARRLLHTNTRSMERRRRREYSIGSSPGPTSGSTRHRRSTTIARPRSVDRPCADGRVGDRSQGRRPARRPGDGHTEQRTTVPVRRPLTPMTTITFPSRLIRPMATPPQRRSTLLGFVATMLAGFIVAVAISIGIGVAAGGTVLSGVSVGGVQLAGLSRDAVAHHLTDQLPSLSAGQAMLDVGDESADRHLRGASVAPTRPMRWSMPPSASDGRQSAHRRPARLRSLVHPATLPVVVHAYDPAALDRIAGEIAARFTVPAVEASVMRTAQRSP